jgi:hypothetical protein
VERFRPGRFANVDHFTVISFHGGCATPEIK